MDFSEIFRREEFAASRLGNARGCFFFQTGEQTSFISELQLQLKDVSIVHC